MSPDFRKVALIAASLGLLVSLFLALRPDGDDDPAPPPATTATTTSAPATAEAEPPPTTTVPGPDAPVLIRIAVPKDTAPTVRRYSVARGRDVELVVSTELTDHVHLHGYDLMADVAPGQPGRIEFTADAPGLFELELEDRGLRIAELEVRP